MVSGDRVIGHIGIQNAGNMPARNLSWFIDIKRSSIGNDATFPLGDTKGNIVISPRATALRGSDRFVLLQDLLTACGSNDGRERGRENPVYLYVWGAVYYNDGFKDGRITKFCHRYNWITRSIDAENKSSISEKFARYHEYGNDAD
jgi:hypothetical protein